MSVFFKDIKMRFSEKCYCYMTDLYNDKGQLLNHDLALYILVQSEEEYSHIWKTKPLAIDTDKGKW